MKFLLIFVVIIILFMAYNLYKIYSNLFKSPKPRTSFDNEPQIKQKKKELIDVLDETGKIITAAHIEKELQTAKKELENAKQNLKNISKQK